MKRVLIRCSLTVSVTALVLLLLVHLMDFKGYDDTRLTRPTLSLPPPSSPPSQPVHVIANSTSSSFATPPNPSSKPHPLLNSTNTNTTYTQDSFLRIFTDGYVIDKFTIVMPTFKRDENLFLIMDQYCDFADIIDKIIILWNNIGRPVPPDVEVRAGKCGVPVVIRVMEKNNLTSRFYPYSQIRTAGILSLDDDNLLKKTSLESAFRVFQKYPYRLVGYDARGFSTQDNKHYHYSFKSQPYTVILTNRGFIHYRYLQLFGEIPSRVKDFIVEHKNGEDLAMNVVVGKYLKDIGRSQCVGVHIQTKIQALSNYSKEKYGGLSRRPSHISDRHKCFQLLADTYGPLQQYLPECTMIVPDNEEGVK